MLKEGDTNLYTKGINLLSSNLSGAKLVLFDLCFAAPSSANTKTRQYLALGSCLFEAGFRDIGISTKTHSGCQKHTNRDSQNPCGLH